VVGLALGGLLASQGTNPTWLLLPALVATGGLAAFLCPALQPKATLSHTQPTYEWAVLLLVLALALRSTVWTGLDLRAEGQPILLLQLALAAGVGKALGGPLADRLTWRGWIVAALVLAAALLALYGMAGAGMTALLAGVFFLQSITPALLAALGAALPGQPGLAASLGLGLAVILGSLPIMTGLGAALSAPPAVFLLLFMMGGLAWCGVRSRL
jgi:FSR family fosmidomycin resistance protein-like MFS transporter